MADIYELEKTRLAGLYKNYLDGQLLQEDMSFLAKIFSNPANAKNFKKDYSAESAIHEYYMYMQNHIKDEDAKEANFQYFKNYMMYIPGKLIPELFKVFYGAFPQIASELLPQIMKECGYDFFIKHELMDEFKKIINSPGYSFSDVYNIYRRLKLAVDDNGGGVTKAETERRQKKLDEFRLLLTDEKHDFVRLCEALEKFVKNFKDDYRGGLKNDHDADNLRVYENNIVVGSIISEVLKKVKEKFDVTISLQGYSQGEESADLETYKERFGREPSREEGIAKLKDKNQDFFKYYEKLFSNKNKEGSKAEQGPEKLSNNEWGQLFVGIGSKEPNSEQIKYLEQQIKARSGWFEKGLDLESNYKISQILDSFNDYLIEKDSKEVINLGFEFLNNCPELAEYKLFEKLVKNNPEKISSYTQFFTNIRPNVWLNILRLSKRNETVKKELFAYLNSTHNAEQIREILYAINPRENGPSDSDELFRYFDDNLKGDTKYLAMANVIFKSLESLYHNLYYPKEKVDKTNQHSIEEYEQRNVRAANTLVAMQKIARYMGGSLGKNQKGFLNNIEKKQIKEDVVWTTIFDIKERIISAATSGNKYTKAQAEDFINHINNSAQEVYKEKPVVVEPVVEVAPKEIEKEIALVDEKEIVEKQPRPQPSKKEKPIAKSKTTKTVAENKPTVKKEKAQVKTQTQKSDKKKEPVQEKTVKEVIVDDKALKKANAEVQRLKIEYADLKSRFESHKSKLFEEIHKRELGDVEIKGLEEQLDIVKQERNHFEANLIMKESEEKELTDNLKAYKKELEKVNKDLKKAKETKAKTDERAKKKEEALQKSSFADMLIKKWEARKANKALKEASEKVNKKEPKQKKSGNGIFAELGEDFRSIWQELKDDFKNL